MVPVQKFGNNSRFWHSATIKLPGVLPQEDMLPKRDCRLADQFLREEIEAVDKCRFPRLLWCYLSGGYRAQPSRRVYIPKADGRQRPLGMASLEVDFLGFSYGSRPGRSQHQALDALVVGVERKQVNWVLDADIRGFLDRVPYCPLVTEKAAAAGRSL